MFESIKDYFENWTIRDYLLYGIGFIALCITAIAWYIDAIPSIFAIAGLAILVFVGTAMVVTHGNFSTFPVVTKILMVLTLLSGGAGGISVLAMQFGWIVDTTIYFSFLFIDVGITTILLAITAGIFALFFILLVLTTKKQGY